MSQKKAISYALFGYNKATPENCFSFDSYLRGLLINIRISRLLFPDWDIVVNLDQSTYDAYKDLFNRLPITTLIHEPAPLCKAMLWRLKPVYETENGKWKYSHVLCRDLDSPPTYRELQAVTYWMMRDTAVHAITDSVSHDVPLMGGMIGVRPDYFTEKCGKCWEDMLMGTTMDFSKKGSDQTFLNHYIYPKFATKGTESITQHYFNGYANTFLSDFHTCTCAPTVGHRSDCHNNTDVNVPYKLSVTNGLCGHIGAAGAYMPVVERFIKEYEYCFEDIIAVEKDYKNIFYWVNA